MGGLFGRARTPAPAPVVIPPAPEPPPITETGPDTGDATIKAAKRRSGFSKTIITGDLEPAPSGTKKTLLGGS